MTTSKHITVVEADVSQYLAAKARQAAADDAQLAAARQLARVMSDHERERIAAMVNAESAAKRAAGERREAIVDARQAVSVARAQQAEIRQTIALHRQEQAEIRRTAVEREVAFARAERAAEKYNATLAKQRGGAGSAVGAGARMGGAVGAGVLGVGLAAKAGFDLADQVVDESYKVQSVSRNLQIDIRAARGELQGMVTDFDLATAANKAFAMKVSDNGADFAHLAGMVGEQATKLGRDQGELVNEIVEAMGKQESEIADNAGITMRLTDAYALQAEALDKSVSSLTKKEKAEAFNKAMIIALEQATGRATVGVDGFANAWKKAEVNIKNFKSSMLGFDDEAGRANEALRELSDEQLERLKFADALNDEDAKRADAMGRTAREMQGHVKQWGLGIMDLKEHADNLNVSYTEMLDNAIAAHAQLFEADKAEMLADAQQETLDIMNEQADAEAHANELLKIMGATEREILTNELSILEARQMAALTQASITKDAKDEAAARKITNEIELTHAKIEMLGKGKSSGKKRDPNEALDLETGATLRLLDARQEIYNAELAGERDLASVAATRQYLISLERQELDIREAAANSRKTKGAKEADELEAERLEILTGRRLLDVEASTLLRDESRRFAEERLAAMDRDIERHAKEGVAVQLLKQRRTEAHVAMVAEFGGAEELREAEHERNMERRAAERDFEVSQAQAKLDAFTLETDIAAARGQQVYDIQSRRLELEAQVAAAENDHDKQRGLLHKRDLARINERRDRFARAQATTNSLMGASVGLFEAVAASTIKNEARREKAVLRARGVAAVATGALETVEGVAAAASFNIPGAILHFAAAATAFATGIPMIAGKVPDKGGAGSGGAGHQTVLNDSAGDGGGGSSSSKPSVPVSAEALIRMREGSGSTTQMTPSGSGGTVINFNAPIVTGDAGTFIVDTQKQAVKKWGKT